MKNPLIKTIFLVSAIVLLTACLQKLYPERQKTPQAEDLEQNSPDPAPLGNNPEKSLSISECADEECFRKIAPRNQMTSLSPEDCKNFDNKKQDDFFKTDLGMICRLIIARSKASFRPIEPCRNDDKLNPDWDPELKSEIGLEMASLALQERLLKENGVTPLDDDSAGNISNANGSYFYDYQTHEKEGEKRKIQFDAYFCITDNPARYSPYFYVLEINDEIKAMNFIETPPTLEPVIFQLDNNQEAIEKIDRQNLDIKTKALSDLDQDGEKDFILILYDSIDGYLPAVCAYNKNGDQCLMKEAQNFFKPAEIKSLWSIRPMIILPGEGSSFKLRLFDESLNKVAAETIYQYSKDQIQLIK